MDRDMWIASAIVIVAIVCMACVGRPKPRALILPPLLTFPPLQPLRAPEPAQLFTRMSYRSARRYVAALVAALTVSAAALLNFAEFGPETTPLATPPAAFPIHLLIWLLPALSIGYFFFVIFYVLFLTLTHEHFDADARLLLLETVLSVLFNVVSAALIYKMFGLHPPDWQTKPLPDMTYLYFSTVTFSTLGYGDFAPLAKARPFAAIQAVLGNLHLGIFVGTVLVALKSSSSQST